MKKYVLWLCCVANVLLGAADAPDSTPARYPVLHFVLSYVSKNEKDELCKNVYELLPRLRCGDSGKALQFVPYSRQVFIMRHILEGAYIRHHPDFIIQAPCRICSRDHSVVTPKFFITRIHEGHTLFIPAGAKKRTAEEREKYGDGSLWKKALVREKYDENGKVKYREIWQVVRKDFDAWYEEMEWCNVSWDFLDTVRKILFGPDTYMIEEELTDKEWEQYRDKTWYEPHHFQAARNNNVALLSAWHKEKHDRPLADADGLTELHHAADGGAINAVRFLLRKKQFLKSLRTNEGLTALHYAACSNRYDIIRLLVELYPDALMVRDKYGRSPLVMPGVHADTRHVMKRLAALYNVEVIEKVIE